MSTANVHNEDSLRATTRKPLAHRMRPRSFDELVGHEDLFKAQGILHSILQQTPLPSILLYGPAGTGKTTIARLIAKHVSLPHEELSASDSGKKDILAAQHKHDTHESMIIFLDEIHRLNKAQQDVFLPLVESGRIILIGATTENPSFEVNAPLLSRMKVLRIHRLSVEALCTIAHSALSDKERGISKELSITDAAVKMLAEAADGDGRKLLNMLETATSVAEHSIDEELILRTMGSLRRVFSKRGDEFYDAISALHKSVRGSDPDAALYWFARMIDGGCDPHYIARRAIRMASEDVGNADPRALTLALHAREVFSQLGSPEGELAIAQALVYLSVAPKSNAVYRAYSRAQKHVKTYGSAPVPFHLRNAPTTFMKKQGYGAQYRYPHDEKGGFAAGVKYFPDEVPETQFYMPVDRGLELQIREKLQKIRELHAQERGTQGTS